MQVIAAKDLLAQLIYERLFQWLMAQINKVLKSEMTGENKYITIVNMPGFGLSKVCSQDVYLASSVVCVRLTNTACRERAWMVYL